MRTYVTILAGPSAAESRPVVSSSHPAVVEAALAAMRRRATEDDPRFRDLEASPKRKEESRGRG